jgi:hypothetical protein
MEAIQKTKDYSARIYSPLVVIEKETPNEI